MASAKQCYSILLLAAIVVLAQAQRYYQTSFEQDRITTLPGQPKSPEISQFSGYITVNEEHGRALFYWFFEAETKPSRRPLLLWLNGGPGCSSIGYGAASELGPLRVSRDGQGLEFNPFAWNKDANLLFLESPVGVGFSYTNTSSDLTILNDAFVAEDAYNFLVNWFKKFPQYQGRDFYLSGESYAGHYVPQLAELVYDRNQEKSGKYKHINLKGFIVGNGLTDYYYDSKGLVEYAWSHAVISDQLYETTNKVCDFKLFNWTTECDNAVIMIFKLYQTIDIYNIYAPKCNLPPTAVPSAFDGINYADNKVGFGRSLKIFSNYDACYSIYAEEYFNRPEVQRSLHANISRLPDGKWHACSNSILHAYDYSVFSILPIYSKLIKAGLRIWVYSGDVDGRVPVIGTRYCVEALGLPLKTPWQQWYLNNQVAGRYVEYQGLTMATVRGAGHLVPQNKPAEALAMIRAFLAAKQLPAFQ